MGMSVLAAASSCCSVLAEVETKQNQIKVKGTKLGKFVFNVVQHEIW